MAETKAFKPYVAVSNNLTTPNDGGEPPGGDEMESRVKRLEEDMKEIKSDLKTLVQNTAEIKGKIDGLPSAYEFGQLKGRVDSLPTFAKIATLVAIATGVIVILNNWSTIKAAVIG